MEHQLLIPNHTLTETERFLKRRGNRDMEGLVLWLGRMADQASVVITMVRAGNEWPHGVRLGFRQMLKLTEFLEKNNLVLLAQVHNHPDRIPHSQGDNDNPASHHLGYISIVVPDMALHGIRLDECYVYEYVGQLTWRELSGSEKSSRLIMVPEGLKL